MKHLLVLFICMSLAAQHKPGWYFPFTYDIAYDIQINSTEALYPKEIRLLDREADLAVKAFAAVAKAHGTDSCKTDIYPIKLFILGFTPDEGSTPWRPFYNHGKHSVYALTNSVLFDLPRLLGDAMSEECEVPSEQRKAVSLELQALVLKGMGSLP